MTKWFIAVLLTSAVSLAGFSADVSGDKYVGLDDLAVIAANWLSAQAPDCLGDTGSDCQVDMADLAVLSQQWQWIECISTATASSQENGSLIPSNAIDGSMSSRWSSSFFDNQWIQVDYGVSRTGYGVTIYWENAYAREYSITVSENGANWTTVFYTAVSDGGTDDINFPLQSFRYLRVNCIDRVTQYGSSIYEIVLKSDDDCHEPPTTRQLVWSDEFTGPSISTANWNWETGGGGWGNNEWEYYTNSTENSYIQDGSLIIVARKDHLGHDYTSARMTTKNKRYFKYGRMEARLKLPALTQGIWPAFWMMPQSSVYGGWAASGEIDIMEAINQPFTVYGTIHYGGSWPNHKNSGGSYGDGRDFSADYHIYAIEWEPTRIRWYIDDILYVTKTSWYTDGYPFPAPFDQPFYFILNVAVGGEWPKYPDETTIFPQYMYIDYIRVYQDVP